MLSGTPAVSEPLHHVMQRGEKSTSLVLHCRDNVGTVFPRIENRALFDPAFIRDQPLFTHIALTVASFKFFSAQFTAQSLKVTLLMVTSVAVRPGLELNFTVVTCTHG